MSVRLREAEAQADLRETRQRMLEMETQVGLLNSGLIPCMQAFFEGVWGSSLFLKLCFENIKNHIKQTELPLKLSHSNLQRAVVTFHRHTLSALFDGVDCPSS